MGADLPTPPTVIKDRDASVHTVQENTLEIPFDPFDPEVATWFDQSAGMRPLTHGNKVTTMVSGPEAFTSMVQAITTANSSGHYIYMLNWFIDLEFALGVSIPGVSADKRLLDLLFAADKKGVEFRGMFWDQVGFQNTRAVDTLNNKTLFSHAVAILDNNTLNAFPAVLNLDVFIAQFLPGSHHQKVLVVKGSEGLIAFVGGVDWNPDRINNLRTGSFSGQAGSPLHDVHCRIEGPAAKQVLKVFIDRWDDHPDTRNFLGMLKFGTLLGSSEPDPPDKGVSHIQIGCTFGNGNEPPGGIKNVNGGRFYTFAPQGERTAERLIIQAISRARRFIYVEDQYMVSIHAAQAFNKALASIEKLIILIPHSDISDHPHVWKMRKDFMRAMFKGLSAKNKKKAVVCYRKEFGDATDRHRATLSHDIERSYVHAKMMIMDDKFAVIGSANCGRRSYTHDSEIVAGIFDESQDDPGRSHVAHDLRIALWARHLALPPDQVFDPIGAAVHWFHPEKSGGVDIYDPGAGTDADSLLNRNASEAQAEPYGGIPGRELNP